MMGVIQIYILLANTTWHKKPNILTANKKRFQFVRKCTVLSQPIICLSDTIVLCINLVRLVWQVSDNHSLNIQGAWTIIRWERTTCKSDRADTNGSNTPGLPEQTDTEATHGPVGSQRWVCQCWPVYFSLCVFLIVRWPEKRTHTHVQHMFPCTSGMTGYTLQSGSYCIVSFAFVLLLWIFPLNKNRQSQNTPYET